MAKTLPPVTVPEPDFVTVVYDAKTGAIRHVHQEITLPGAEAGPAGQSTQRAIALAQEMTDRPTARLDALTLGADDRSTLLRSRVPLKVDVKNRRLAAVPARRARKPTARRRTR
jgi:hypothetical protein